MSIYRTWVITYQERTEEEKPFAVCTEKEQDFFFFCLLKCNKVLDGAVPSEY